MFFKNKLCKFCLLLTSSIAATTPIVGLASINNANNNIVKNVFNISKTTNISGTINLVENYDHVEVNLSGYDIDLNKYNVNVDQTSETGIPLNNGFQIHFEIVSKAKFKVYRTSVRKYYRLYILDKQNNATSNDKQYFEKIIKVDNFNNGSSTPKKQESNIDIINPNDSTSLNKFKDFFVNKRIFIKEKGFDKNYLDSMKSWNVGKFYDEMNGNIFNVSSKSTFENEVESIGHDLQYDESKDIETLNFWIKLKDQYIFKVNNENTILLYSDFQIERDLPPPIPPINGDANGSQSNLSSSTTKTTIFAVSISTALLFIIAIILFIVINNKNKIKQRRNYDLEKAIKNRRKY